LLSDSAPLKKGGNYSMGALQRLRAQAAPSAIEWPAFIEQRVCYERYTSLSKMRIRFHLR